MKAALCTQCGAKIEVDETKEFGYCPNCGTQYVAEKVLSNYYKTVNVGSVNVSVNKLEDLIDNESTFVNVFKVPKKYSEKEFLRQVFWELGTDKDLPKDIMKQVTFGQVRESTREIIKCSAYVKSDYSASVGYDRKEQYIEQVRKYDSNNHPYYENVTRERTVTDWRPFSGHAEGDAIGYGYNNNKTAIEGLSLFSDHRLKEVILSCKASAVVQAEQVPVHPEGVARAKSDCRIGLDYPGDHVRDKHVSDNVTVNSLECYIVPFYEVEYTYEGKKYNANGFGSGAVLPLVITPSIKDKKEDLSLLADEQTKKFKIAALASCLLLRFGYLVLRFGYLDSGGYSYEISMHVAGG